MNRKHILDEVDRDLGIYSVIRGRINHHRKGKRVREAVLRDRKRTKIHTLVAQRMLGRRLERDEMVDHKDGDPLNNSRSNLRVCSSMQNCANRMKTRGISKYKGVYYNKTTRDTKKWRAQMSLVGLEGTYIRLSLGNYKTEKEAGLAYNSIAGEWYGEYARLNKVK